MLLFRSEEHALEWQRTKNLGEGATLTLDQQWRLADAWYSERLDPEWQRRTPQEAEALFAELGLTGPFWRFTAP